MRFFKRFVLAIAAAGIGAVACSQHPSPVGGWKVELVDDSGEDIMAEIFANDLLRIRPNGEFELYRMELRGEWGWVGDDLILKPTRFGGQSIEGFSAMAEIFFGKFGEVAEALSGGVDIAFGSPMTMRMKGDDIMIQSPDIRVRSGLRWIRAPEPPLLERLKAMDQDEAEGGEFDFPLYAYHYAGIEDDVEDLASGLDAVLHDDSKARGVRHWAAIMLRFAKEYDVVTSLTRGLADGNLQVRRSCASALSQHGDSAAIPAMIEAYNAERIGILSITWLIEGTDYNEAAPFLLAVINSDKERDRSYALEALAGLKPVDGTRKREYAQAALPLLDDEESDRGTRVAAARVLMTFSVDKAHRHRAFTVLIDATDDQNWMVRIDAIEGLADSGLAKAIPHVISALKDTDPTVRRHAARHLGELDAKEAIGDIEAAWQTEQYARTREAMFQALKKLRDKSCSVKSRSVPSPEREGSAAST